MPKGNSYATRPGGIQGTEEITIFTSTDTYNCTLSDIITLANLASYALVGHTHSSLYEPIITKTAGYAVWTGSTWSFINETYSLSSHNHSGVYSAVGHDHSGVYEPVLGFTAENIANKSTNVVTDGSSDTKYPSVKAIKDYADGLVVGLLDDRGNYDASGNTFPTTGGSGTAGAILKGDLWYISVQGTLGGILCSVGYSIRALTDTPGQTSTNWDILNVGLGFVPESTSNKVTSISGSSTDTQYGSAKLLFDQLALKANLAGAAFTGDISSTGKYTGRIGRNIQSTTSTAIFTHNCESYQSGKLTAQAADLTMANPTGAELDGEQFIMRLKDNGVSRTITWESDFANCGGVMPTATVADKWHTIGFIYSTTDSKYYCISAIVQP